MVPLNYDAWVTWQQIIDHNDWCEPDGAPAGGTLIADLPEDYRRPVAAAIDFFHFRTGRTWPGQTAGLIANIALTPFAESTCWAYLHVAGQVIPYNAMTSRPTRVVRLQPNPVAAVTEVVVDGSVFADWELTGDRLWRTDGDDWPSIDVNNPWDTTDLFKVTYTAGANPDALWRHAALDLAVQLVAADKCPKKCRLPRYWESINRDGIAVRRLASSPEMQRRALTGISPFIDQALQLVSLPSGSPIIGSTSVHSPDLNPTFGPD